MVIPTTGASAADEKPHIHINTASGDNLGLLTGTNIGFVRFAQIAREKGFTIDHGVHPDLVSGSPLEGIDVYVLFDPNFPFTDEDKVALRQWVRAGGILITSDYLSKSVISRFLEEFGVELSPWENDYRDLKFTANSPLKKPLKINWARTRQGLSGHIIDSTRSEALLMYDDGTVAMSRTTSHAGKGEIIAVPCMVILFDDTVGGDIKLVDNDKLVQNFFSYMMDRIIGSSDGEDDAYDLNLLKLKTKGGSSFNPGDDIKFVARIRNIGTQQGEETRVAFYIERTGAATSMRIEVDGATINAIGAKKKIKIVKKAFLPDDLAPGTYEVTAVIDPDELTDDANTNNNGATAKKKIIVQ